MKVEEIDLRAVIENESNDRFNRNNKICCPIHKEKTPSLSLDAKRNKWRCFGCGCGGDAIDFIREVRGLNYVEACQYLGVDLNEDYKVLLSDGVIIDDENIKVRSGVIGPASLMILVKK